jgi:hypothetical protein
MIIYNIVKIFNKKVFKNNLNEKLKLVRTMKKKKNQENLRLCSVSKDLNTHL